MPVILAMLAIVISAIMLSHRISSAVSNETAVVNAADAAAYSAAVWTARRMNLMAYANRALVANHIAIGHLTAYVSWLRYLDQASTRVAVVTRFIPYAGAAITAAARAVRFGRATTERLAPGFIQGADILHRLMSAAQLDARLALRPGAIDEVMRRVVKQHDASFTVNDSDTMDALPQPYQFGLDAYLTAHRFTLPQRFDRAVPGRDRRQFDKQLGRTIRDNRNLSRWLRGERGWARPRYGTGGRTWSDSVFRIVRFRKQGPTSRRRQPDAGGWRSADRLQISWFNPKKWSWGSWATLASGRADADRLRGNYDGVKSYTQLSNGTRDARGFVIPAVVVAPIPGQSAETQAVNAHLSVAQVQYRIPDRCQRNCPSPDAPATLFNPYWEAQLTHPDLPNLP